jgi:hypothetical protein
MNNDKGGWAFPRPASEGHQHGMHSPQEGMTLRDYFAAKAMAAILGSPHIPYEFEDDVLTSMSYRVADAMLKAREL